MSVISTIGEIYPKEKDTPIPQRDFSYRRKDGRSMCVNIPKVATFGMLVLSCLLYQITTYFGLNPCIIANKCPIKPPNPLFYAVILAFNVIILVSLMITPAWVSASSAMSQSILRYGSEHPRLWVRAYSAMGRSILDYGSEHPRLWVRASSTMGQSILRYGSEHAPLWVSASSTMGRSMLGYGSEHARLWVSTCSAMGQHMLHLAQINDV